MICPRCQGLVVNEYEEERCINCGYRTNFVAVERSPYTPYDQIPDVRPNIKQPASVGHPTRPLTSPSDDKVCVRDRVRKYRAMKRRQSMGT